MFICQECHNKRQERKAIESQPIQWTGYKYSNNHYQNCPDCSKGNKGEFYQYLNAFELTAELQDLKDRLKNLEIKPEFPVNQFYSASDMLNVSSYQNEILRDQESFKSLIQYAVELEEIIDNISE